MILEQQKSEDSKIVVSSTLYQMEQGCELLLVPDNLGELIVPFSDNIMLRLIGSAKPIPLDQEQCYFLKPRRRGMEILSEETTKFLIAKVNPFHTNLICKDLSEASNGIHELESQELALRRLEGPNGLDAEVLEDILMQEAAIEDRLMNAMVVESIEQIRLSSGKIKIKDIYSSLNVSKSRLEQLFNKEIGLTPKEYCKIEKINYFIDQYKSKLPQSLTELTNQCGYYDQSHLIKDFKYFLETSPRSFFAKHYNGG